MPILSEELQGKIVKETGVSAPDLSDPTAFQSWLSSVKEENPALFGEIAFEIDEILCQVAKDG